MLVTVVVASDMLPEIQEQAWEISAAASGSKASGVGRGAALFLKYPCQPPFSAVTVGSTAVVVI